MAIIPTIKCSHLARSVAFYTEVLDFERTDEGDLADPGFAAVAREGAPLYLSSHRGDGMFGQAIVVTADDVDALFRKFRARGLRTAANAAESPVHAGPVDQTWGTREFYIDDPDGNTLRFTQQLE